MLARLMRILTLTLAAGLAPAAWAQGVGDGSPTDTNHGLKSTLSVPEIPIHWTGLVGTPEVPSGVSLDPFGPVWSKAFQPEQGAINYPARIIRIEEHLLIEGELPWSGWYMGIQTQGFEWEDSFLSLHFYVRANGSAVPGTSLEFLPCQAIRFGFPELMPGTEVEISAKFSYTGTDPFAGTVHLQQYPLPEPASVLSLLSLTFFVFHRGRRFHARISCQ